LAPALAFQEFVGGARDRKSRVPVPYKNKNSAPPREDVKEGSGGGERGWQDVGTNAHSGLSKKRLTGNTKGRKFLQSLKPSLERPPRC
jgi:hypothetical protein